MSIFLSQTPGNSDNNRFHIDYLVSPNSSGMNLGQIFSVVQITVAASLVPIPHASCSVLP